MDYEDEMFEVREMDLDEVLAHVDLLLERLYDDQRQLDDYLDNHFEKWVGFVNEMVNTFESKGFKPSLPAFIIDFANNRDSFLNEKRKYIADCIALIKEFDAERNNADSFDLTEFDAILTSVARSLGYLCPTNGDFMHEWFKREGS